MEHKKRNAMLLLIMAMITFGVLGLEFGVLFISTLIDGRSLSQVGSWPIHWYGAISHWILTMMIWSIGIRLIYKWAKKKKDLLQYIDFTFSKKTIYLMGAAILIAIGSAFIQHLIWDSSIPQLANEFRGFKSMYPNHAFIVTLFQVIYYGFEMVLVFMMIVLFQAGFEIVFKNKKIPYGSFGLMLTWGLIHFISNPQGAFIVTIWALVPGLLYIYGGKRFWPVYALLILGFIF